MLWLALLGAKATLPQYVPHHADDLEPRPKEGVEVVVLHCRHSNPLSRLVHDFPVVAAPVVLAAVACVVIVILDEEVTHLWVLRGSIPLIDGSGVKALSTGSIFSYLHTPSGYEIAYTGCTVRYFSPPANS